MMLKIVLLNMTAWGTRRDLLADLDAANHFDCWALTETNLYPHQWRAARSYSRHLGMHLLCGHGPSQHRAGGVAFGSRLHQPPALPAVPLAPRWLHSSLPVGGSNLQIYLSYCDAHDAHVREDDGAALHAEVTAHGLPALVLGDNAAT